MKKIVGTLLLGLLLSLTVVNISQAKTVWKDVSSNQRFYEEISYLEDQGIISGFQDQTFRPNQAVTRAQAAIMIGRALDLDGTPRSTKFKDVDSSQVASGYIASAVERGIISGYPDKTYRPGESVTRGQMAIFLDRAFELKTGKSNAFTDVSGKMVAYQSILNVAAERIASGYTDGSYRPGQAVTRGQFSAFLARTLEPSFRGVPASPYVGWAGEWKNKFGTITISNETADSFDFHINVVMNYHVGDITGKAKIERNSAVYTEYIEDFDGFYDNPNCEINFTRNLNSITVQETAACTYWHGFNATFDGTYSKQ